jgi:predicted ATPase
LRTRITRHLDVLRSAGSEAPARQRTLVATFEWSYDLLAQPERVLLRRLAIFAGGCTLEAAEQVSAGNHEFLVCETLASLVEKSLAVAYLQGNVTRYRLLDSTRAFALEKLAASGEREVIARSHADWMASFADRADKTYQVEPRQGWMTKVEGELNDARAALEWALRPGGDAILAGASPAVWAVCGESPGSKANGANGSQQRSNASTKTNILRSPHACCARWPARSTVMRGSRRRVARWHSASESAIGSAQRAAGRALVTA